MKIYLDMCCYNRPYDEQSQLKVAMETQSKLHIQNLIKEKQLELISSYMLRYECSNNPFEMRRNTIFDFMHKNTFAYAGCEYFISTDIRLLKYRSDEIKLVTPIEFVTEMESE